MSYGLGHRIVNVWHQLSDKRWLGNVLYFGRKRFLITRGLDVGSGDGQGEGGRGREGKGEEEGEGEGKGKRVRESSYSNSNSNILYSICYKSSYSRDSIFDMT